MHVDPKSPVAKEYALPLASARGAAPESGNSGRLFGSGIKHGTNTVTQAASGSATGTVTSSADQTPPSEGPPVTTPVAASSPPVPTVTEPTPDTESAPATTTRPATSPRHTPSQHVTAVTLPDLNATTGLREVRAAPAAYKVLDPGSGSGVLWMVLAAALVVLLGSAGGVFLSCRR